MRRLLSCVAALAALAFATAARADWHKAETDLFVVYGNVREDALREYAVKLTNFDRVLRLYAPPAKDAPPLHKLDVYVLRDHGDLAQIAPHLASGIVGFYAASPQAVFAAVTTPPGLTSKDEVLFHEYAHHYMLENFPAPYPGWFVEGWADYFATTKFTATGFDVGGYDLGRVSVLARQEWLPLEAVLSKAPDQTQNVFQFYSQAWLLTHYMYDDPQRRDQLNTATQAIAHGADPVKAMEQATGLSVRDLTGKLRNYRQIHISRATGASLGPDPTVTMTVVPDSVGDFLLDRLRIAGADWKKPDAGYLRDLKARALKTPDSEFAQLTLASAEYVYGDPAAGDAIAQRYIDAHADDIEALRVAGLGRMTAAERFKDRRDDFYRRARAVLIQAYAIDKDDYRVLFAYARSRAIEAAYPNDNDLNALLAARTLGPSVQEISLMTGAALMRRGQAERAKLILAAVANNPHAGRMAKVARAVMDGKSLEDAIAEQEPGGKPAPAKAPTGGTPGPGV